MAVQEPTQRRFAVMGTNAFNMANKLMQNQRICRLLKYQVRDPFDTDKYEDVDGVLLLNKQIMITPKIWDESTEKTSYIVALFDTFVINSLNQDFKTSVISFDIAFPYESSSGIHSATNRSGDVKFKVYRYGWQLYTFFLFYGTLYIR